MAGSRYFSGEGPERPHLSRGEVADLRNDTEAAFKKVQDDMDLGLAPLVVEMIPTADVSGGGTTQTVGFQLKTVSGVNVAEEILVEFAVFDGADCAVPAVTATLSVASAGTIVGPVPTLSGNALKVKTSAAGLFTCTLTDFVDQTVYLAASPTFGGTALNCRDIDSVTFSA